MVGGRKPDAPVTKKVLLICYRRVENILRGECQKGNISSGELRIRNRRGEFPRVRSEIAERLVKELGLFLAEVARLLGLEWDVVDIWKRNFP